MSTNNDIQSVIDVVKSCDDVQLCTMRLDGYPETRHVMNAMNRQIDDLELHFITGRETPKFKQIRRSPRCCLYYFNPQTRYAVRLFGEIAEVTDLSAREKFWRDDYKKFGYAGPSDSNFVLLRITPTSYKFYVGDEMRTGVLVTRYS